jgi:hypothetical protein
VRPSVRPIRSLPAARPCIVVPVVPVRPVAADTAGDGSAVLHKEFSPGAAMRSLQSQGLLNKLMMMTIIV